MAMRCSSGWVYPQVSVNLSIENDECLGCFGDVASHKSRAGLARAKRQHRPRVG